MTPTNDGRHDRKHPDRIPVSASILPSAWMKHRKALDEILRRHPQVFGRSRDQQDYNAVGG